ncbi:MAG: PEP-CTERM sorting domain-containing protein [Hyphomicrobiales bacterium]|nr:PEP-CTERM sorting domain-containing protein [Hyphomicrobiales bacterium]
MQVSAETDYYFEIVDNSNPTAILPVPIVVNAAGGYTYSVDTPGYEEFLNSDFNSSFYVSGVLTDQILWYSDIDGSLAPGSNSWSDNNTYTMYTNELYTVSLVAGFAIGMGGNEGGGTQMMSVYVDPTFAVGSGADPSQYSLVFSDGVGNAAAGAVPESSTWAMMLIGFAGLGFGARRRLAAAAVA